jgi:hypothetical protein
MLFSIFFGKLKVYLQNRKLHEYHQHRDRINRRVPPILMWMCTEPLWRFNAYQMHTTPPCAGVQVTARSKVGAVGL